MTVNAGNGERIVGTLERSPNDAGTSNPKPAMSVATALFEPIFNGYSNFPVESIYSRFIQGQCLVNAETGQVRSST